MVNVLSSQCGPHGKDGCADCQAASCQHFCHGDRAAKGPVNADMTLRAENRVKQARRGGGLASRLATYGGTYTYEDRRRY